MTCRLPCPFLSALSPPAPLGTSMPSTAKLQVPGTEMYFCRVLPKVEKQPWGQTDDGGDPSSTPHGCRELRGRDWGEGTMVVLDEPGTWGVIGLQNHGRAVSQAPVPNAQGQRVLLPHCHEPGKCWGNRGQDRDLAGSCPTCSWM